MRIATATFAAALALVSGGTPWAQQAPPAGNPLDALPPVPSNDAGDVRVEQAPAPETPGMARAVTPSRFEIQGVRSIAFAQVAALFSPLVGRPATVGELVERARRATDLYARAGYALAFVYVPAQDLRQGVVRVVAVEGYIRDVQVKGEVGRSEEQITAIAAKMQAEKPLTRATFDRAVALLGQLPGFSITARVPTPSGTDGGTILELDVRRKAVSAVVGSELGPPQPRAILTAELNDVLVPGGQVSASTLLHPLGKETYHALHAVQPLGSDGLLLKVSASLFEGATRQVPVGTAMLEQDTSTRRIDATASYPLLLSASRSLVLSGGLYGTANRERLANPVGGAWMQTDSHVRATQVQLAYAQAGASARSSASLLVAHGIDELGAGAVATSNLPGLAGPLPVNLQFTRVLLQAADTRRSPSGFGTAATLISQWSRNSLPASERIGFGGTRFARGYAPGEVSGDSGWGLGGEANWRFAPASLPVAVEPYLLVEAARASHETAAVRPSDLRSISLGARVSRADLVTADLALSRPVGDRPLANPERKPRVSLLVSYRLDRL